MGFVRANGWTFDCEIAGEGPDLVTSFAWLDNPLRGIRGALGPFPDLPEVLAGMARFRELPPIAGASRFVHWERPREFNAALREFLAASPSAQS